MQPPPLHKLSFMLFFTASLLCPLSLSAALTDPSNPAYPILDTLAPIITAVGTDLSIPVDATPTAPNVTPIVTPRLDTDAAVTGIVANGIVVTDKVVATDTETTFTFRPTGKIGPLGPGEHTITWTATDLGLNSTSADQTITVLPSINLSLDQEVGEGGMATVTAHLNGKAPSYPVTVPYIVVAGTADAADHNAINGNFVFATDEIAASISFSIVDDGLGDAGQTFNIDLGGLPATQVFPGHKTSHQITITETNLAPLAHLHAKQNNQISRIITTDTGKVTVCAMPDCGDAYDANGDTLRYDWSASDNALIPITGTTGNRFEFEAQELNPGFYNIRLTVSDTAGKTSAHDLLLKLLETETVLTTIDSDDDKRNDISEGFYDDDNDGIPNFLDAIENNPSLIQAYEPYLFDPNLKQNDSYTINSITLSWTLLSGASSLTAYPLLIATNPGLHINIGPTAFAAGKSYARLATSTAEKLRRVKLVDGLVSSDDGQVVDIEISRLNTAGDSAYVIIPLVAPVPISKTGTSPVFMIYTKFNSWDAFSNINGDQINTDKKRTDAYCPDFENIANPPALPAAPPYPATSTLAAGTECLLVRIQDGGPNDYDGIANGTIRLMGAVFVAGNNQTEGEVFTGNIDATQEGLNKLDIGTGNGGGSLDIMSLFSLLLTVLIHRRRKKINKPAYHQNVS